jgi:hypothetical protein
MNEEREQEFIAEDDFDGLERPTDLQGRFNFLAELGQLEQRGGHAHSLEVILDPTKSKTIAHAIEELDPNHQNGEGLEDTKHIQRKRFTDKGIPGRIKTEIFSRVSNLTSKHQ